MEQFQFGMFDGSVYEKATEASFTYVHYSSVRTFIHHILDNNEVDDQIAVYVHPIIALLSERSCKIISPLVLDFNFIEVLPKGYCFNIERKVFEHNPTSLKGMSHNIFKTF